MAAASNDTAPVLATLGATLVVISRERGERTIPIADFYIRDGIYNKDMQPDELLVPCRIQPAGTDPDRQGRQLSQRATLLQHGIRHGRAITAARSHCDPVELDLQSADTGDR